MLTFLHIQDFVLIRQLSLPLASGLTALTGETGAGKSILLDALGLAAGARATRAAVRKGADKGVVTAVFEPPANHPVWARLDEHALPLDGDQVILKRIYGVDGKSRAFINDHPASIALLKSVGETLVEIHGQHDGRGFLSAATHRDLLDDYAGAGTLAAATAEAWKTLRDSRAALAAAEEARARNAAEVDYLRHMVGELSKLAPQEGEEEELAGRRASLMAAEKIRDDLLEAARLIGEDGLEGKLAAAARRLMRASQSISEGDNPLSGAIERIDRVLSEMMEARSAVEAATDALAADPDELERAEERLFALRAAARKHGVRADELAGVLHRAESALDELDGKSQSISKLGAQVAAAEKAFFEKARTLSKMRRQSGAKLDEVVAKELAPLKLGRAVFQTQIVTDEMASGPDGIDKVEFVVATNPGAAPGPLKSIASGGELSRFVLAMKAALAASEERTVIIFDEIDAGVGGAVADAVGERLARLARDAQVLVVTHSPQVAARAQRHWLVEKAQLKDETLTEISDLDEVGRIEEIARMLSGATVSAEARAAARRLLGVAPAGKPGARKTGTRKATRAAS